MTRFCLTLALLSAALLAFRCPPAAADKFEWQSGKWSAATRPAEGTPEGELAIVSDRFETGRYSQAVAAGKKFVKKYPASAEYEEVCLLAGRAEMARQRYYQAFEWFEKQLNQFPVGKFSGQALGHEYEVAEAFLSGKKRIALGFVRLNATSEALEILTRIAEHSPGTEIASQSLMRVADHHFSADQWDDAVKAYDTYVKLFPKSPKTAYAAGRAALATWLSFAGPRFDETPLIEAEQRFRILLEAYPEQAEAIGARDILAKVISARAEQLYETAKFYRRIGRPAAAAFYYREVCRQYPNTEWAEQARPAVMAMEAADGRGPAQSDEGPGAASQPATHPARPDPPDSLPAPSVEAGREQTGQAPQAAETSKGSQKR